MVQWLLIAVGALVAGLILVLLAFVLGTPIVRAPGLLRDASPGVQLSRAGAP